LCFRWGVRHVITTPYYPQGSLAERVNRNLKAGLKIFNHQSQDCWDEGLLWLSFAFNAAWHESTRTTPDLLFLGREVKSPLTSRWDFTALGSDGDNSENQSFWAQAYQNLKSARNRVAQRYNMNRRPHSFKIGDAVMYKEHPMSSKARNISGKLLLRWSKPVVISRIVNDNNVVLTDPVTGETVRKAHVSQLESYFQYVQLLCTYAFTMSLLYVLV